MDVGVGADCAIAVDSDFMRLHVRMRDLKIVTCQVCVVDACAGA